MKKLLYVAALSVSLGLVGCADSEMDTRSLPKDAEVIEDVGANEGLGFDVTDPAEEEAIEEVGEEAVSKAEKIAEDISYNDQLGKLDLDELVDTSKLDELKEKFDEVLSPVTGVIEKIKNEINKMREIVVAEMDLLDPSLPEHAAALAKLQRALDKLDRAEHKVDRAAEKILGKVTKLYEKLDRLIEKIDSANLIWIILKSQFKDFRDNKVEITRLLLLGVLSK